MVLIFFSERIQMLIMKQIKSQLLKFQIMKKIIMILNFTK